MPKALSESNLLKVVGNSLREARLSRGISQEDLAYKANISRNYYNSVENGHRNIAVINLIKIALALEAESMDVIIDLMSIENNKVVFSAEI
jgi:transcriptional regulator with XRE-family HTH domain